MRRPPDPHAANLAPLSPPVFHILLSLADAPRHGYGILLEVEARTDGRVRLGTSTLYTALKRLLAAAWVEEASAPLGEADPRRERHYRLTARGRAALRAEARRLESMVAQARGKDVLGGAAS
jgi:DNA-binding PadR family transcriptional regulator